MKKVIKTVVITLILLTGITVGGLFWLTSQKKDDGQIEKKVQEEESGESKTKAFVFSMPGEATPLLKDGAGKNLLVFEHSDIYNTENSGAAKQRLDRLVSRTSPSFDEPLIAYNPFGTNKNTLYFSFHTNRKVAVKYTITVEDENIPDFVRTVYNKNDNNLSKEHEFSVGGLVPGMTNYIIISLCDENGNVISSHTYSFDAEAAFVGAPTTISVEKGKISEESTSNGLYFVFAKGISAILSYDNSGILRGETLLEEEAGKRLIVNYDDIFYAVSKEKLVHVSPVGQVAGVYSLKTYGSLVDFDYDGYGNLNSVTRKDKRSYLIRVDIQTGGIAKVITFKKDVKADSIAVPGDGSAYVGCKSPVGILRVSNVASRKGKVSGIIGKKSDWKADTKKVYKKEGKGKSAGSVRLLMYNNDVGTLSFLNAGKQEETGSYYEYEIKNDKKTFSLLREVKAKVISREVKPAFQKEYGSAQCYAGHFVVSCGGDSGFYREYDAEGEVIKEFNTGMQLKSVIKMNLKQTCFK